MSVVLRVHGNSGRWPILARQSAKEAAAQWLWFASGIDAERVGYGDGLLTWARSARQKIVKRDIHICLLTCSKDPLQLGPLTAWTINQRSRHCSASVNEGLERADIVWVYAKDPLTPECRAEFDQKLLKARPEAKVINRPSTYNSYHRDETFPLLESHGVSVPRSSFTAHDLGVTQVVYKELGRQAAPKRNVLYGGPRPGMTAFEFIDSAQQDGLYRRFRAHYFLGMVRPSEIFLSDHWNVCMRNVLEVQYGFRLTQDEISQIRSIANLLELDYFAVDFVRRASDDQPFFTDINVYPCIASPRQLVHRRGDFGKWHTFDACARLGLDEPLGGCVWDHFDSAVMNFAHGGRRHANVSAAAGWSAAAGMVSGAHKSRPLTNAAGLHLALPAGVGERLDGQDGDWARSDRALPKAGGRPG